MFFESVYVLMHVLVCVCVCVCVCCVCISHVFASWGIARLYTKESGYHAYIVI